MLLLTLTSQQLSAAVVGSLKGGVLAHTTTTDLPLKKKKLEEPGGDGELEDHASQRIDNKRPLTNGEDLSPFAASHLTPLTTLQGSLFVNGIVFVDA